MPATTPQQDAEAFTQRSAGITLAAIAANLGITTHQAAHGVTRHARINSLPDPVQRRSVRAAARYASSARLPFDAESFAAANALAVPSEMGGAFVTGRTFGIEIEFQRPNRQLSPETIAQALRDAGLEAHEESYNHTTRPHWKLIHDASSDRELVSPILSGREGLRQVRVAMRTLRTLGCRVGSTEGMHVHVYAGDFTPVRVADVFGFYAQRQLTVFNNLVSRARRNHHYCSPITTRDYERTAAYCRQGVVRPSCGRYVTVNLESFARYQTIEFRQHQGSLNGRKACDWIEMLLATVTAVEQNVETQCPTDLHGTLEFLVAARLLKRATADRLARKAQGYGWTPPTDPAPVAAPTPVAAPAVETHGTDDALDGINLIYADCACVACVEALRLFYSGTASLRVVDRAGEIGPARNSARSNYLSSSETVVIGSAREAINMATVTA